MIVNVKNKVYAKEPTFSILRKGFYFLELTFKNKCTFVLIKLYINHYLYSLLFISTAIN